MANNEELILNVETNNPYVIGAIAYVEQLENGAKITIVDKNGTTVATVYDGTDGTNGKGIASVTLNSDYTLTFLYTDGTTTTTTSVRGATGDSGVYIGDIEPSDPAVNVWVDTEGDPYPMDEEIAVAVDGWITDHPEYVTTVEDGAITVPKFAASVVDATLTQTGHPADAKATGDAITADRTRLTAVEGEADSLDARITNLAQLTDGSTTGDAELIDARVVGTTTYSTLHQAIDTEFTNVKSDLGADITALGIRSATNYIPKTDGTWANNTVYLYRQYRVDILPEGILCGYSNLGAGYGVVFKDADGNFISSVTPDNETHIFYAPIPSNAVIAQIAIYVSSESDFYVKFCNIGNAVYSEALKNNLTSENVEVVTIDQDDISFVSGYLSWVDGSISSNPNFITSEKIRCVPGSTVTYELIGYGGVVFVINVYDEYNQLVTDVFPQGSGWLPVSGTLVLPDDAYYIQFSTRNTTYSISMQTYVEINNVVVIENESTCLPNYTFEDGKYIDCYTGTIGDYANLRLSDYIEVSGGDRILYSLRGIKNYNACIAAYDENQNYLSNNSIWNTAGAGGTFGQIDGTYTVPNTVKYVRINTHKDVYYSSFQLIHEVEKTPAEVIDTMRNQWKNKKWLAFGTSLTDLRFINKETDEIVGKYVPYLADLSGLIVTERGKAGGALVGNILTEILSTDVSDYDIVTIEGFVNDFAAGSPIGDIADTGNTTFYGCLYQAINYIQSHSHALVALIGDSTGREYTFQHDPSLIGHTVNYEYNRSKTVDGVTVYQSTYKDAMRKFADFAGCIFIDAGAESEINMNHPEYFADHLHHNDLGGKQFAQAIWNRLKQLNPLVLNE